MAYSKEIKIEFIKIYAEYLGNISASIEKFNKRLEKELNGQIMTRRTFYNWKENPEILTADGSTFADLVDDADNKVIDNADFFLKAQTGKNNLKAICFLLKHRHPDYRQKIDVNQTGERIKANEEIEKLKEMFEYVKSTTSKPVGSEQEGADELAKLRPAEDTSNGAPIPEQPVS